MSHVIVYQVELPDMEPFEARGTSHGEALLNCLDDPSTQMFWRDQSNEHDEWLFDDRDEFFAEDSDNEPVEVKVTGPLQSEYDYYMYYGKLDPKATKPREVTVTFNVRPVVRQQVEYVEGIPEGTKEARLIENQKEATRDD